TGTATGTTIPVRVGTAFPSSDVSFPVLVPLLGAGGLTIEPTKDARSSGLLRSVLLRLVAATAPGSLRIRAIDPTGAAFADFSPLFDGRVMPPPATDRAGLRVILAEAEQWIRTPPQPGRHLLLVVGSMPTRADAADMARLAAIAENGLKARVSVLIVSDAVLP